MLGKKISTLRDHATISLPQRKGEENSCGSRTFTLVAWSAVQSRHLSLIIWIFALTFRRRGATLCVGLTFDWR